MTRRLCTAGVWAAGKWELLGIASRSFDSLRLRLGLAQDDVWLMKAGLWFSGVETRVGLCDDRFTTLSSLG